MNLSQQAINDFKKAYFEVYVVELTDEEAEEMGTELLEFFKIFIQRK